MTARGRRTLASPAGVEGVGLFTGRPVRCTLKPATQGGIAFSRTDHPARGTVAAHISELSGTPVHPVFAQLAPRNTALGRDPDGAVFTTEHVLGALHGLGITDAVIELDAPELPIGDGSARLFVEAIERAGLTELPGGVEPIVVTETVRVESPDGAASITAAPVPDGGPAGFVYELDYGPEAPIRPQRAAWQGGAGEFAREIAPARTFSLAVEAAQMRDLGMFTSFTPRDLLVIDEAGSPIDNAWRFEDEAARHKLLDLIGDLALAGRPVHGQVTSIRGGHALNHAMARALLRFA